MADASISSLLGADGTALVGEAARLRFELQSRSAAGGEASNGLVETLARGDFREELASEMERLVRKKFGKRYLLEGFAIDLNERAITASVSTLFDENVSLKSIAKRVAALSAAIRRELCSLVEAYAGTRASVRASWSRGEGLFDPSRLLSPETPAPQLEAQLAALRARRRRARRIRTGAVFIALVFVLIAIPVAGKEVNVVFAAYLRIYAALALAAAFVTGSRINDLDADSREIANELDLRMIGTKDIESRAQKLFQSHSHELKRYYDQALQHGRTIFFVGLACLLLGFVVIGASLWLVVERGGSGSSQDFILGGLGAVAGILANFIAIVYLRMFSDTVQATTGFHQRLVMTHHLHFGNFLW